MIETHRIRSAVCRPCRPGDRGPLHDALAQASHARLAASRIAPAPRAPRRADATRVVRRTGVDSSARVTHGRSSAGTYSAASPQLSRATGVSSSTGGTPAASASSGVRPSPSYSDRNAKARAWPYSSRELGVGDVLGATGRGLRVPPLRSSAAGPRADSCDCRRRCRATRRVRGARWGRTRESGRARAGG